MLEAAAANLWAGAEGRKCCHHPSPSSRTRARQRDRHSPSCHPAPWRGAAEVEASRFVPLPYVCDSFPDFSVASQPGSNPKPTSPNGTDQPTRALTYGARCGDYRLVMFAGGEAAGGIRDARADGCERSLAHGISGTGRHPLVTTGTAHRDRTTGRNRTARTAGVSAGRTGLRSTGMPGVGAAPRDPGAGIPYRHHRVAVRLAGRHDASRYPAGAIDHPR